MSRVGHSGFLCGTQVHCYPLQSGSASGTVKHRPAYSFRQRLLGHDQRRGHWHHTALWQHGATLYTLPHWQPLRPSESDCPPECQCAIAQVCESRQLELETVDSEDPHRKHRDTSMVAEWPGSPRQFLSPFPGTNTDVYSRAFFKFSQAAIGSGSRSSGVRSPTRSPLCWPCPTWPCRATRPGVSPWAQCGSPCASASKRY